MSDSTLPTVPLPAATCEKLFSGLLECHDTVALLADYALNAKPSLEMGGMYATLCLLQRHIDTLSVTLDPRAMRALTEHSEVHHAY